MPGHEVESKQADDKVARNLFSYSDVGKKSTTVSAKREEPNFVIYNLIKEIDFLVESSSGGISHDQELLSTSGQGSELPDGILNDYKDLLQIAIDIFQNNYVSKCLNFLQIVSVL